MSVAKISDIIIFGIDVLKTTVNAVTSTITAQIGDVVSQSVTSQDAEWWQHVGFASRPPAPSAGVSACQTVALRRSDRDACIASRDIRGQAIYGNLSDGETCLYAGGPKATGQAKVFLRSDGSASLVTTDTNTSLGNTIKLSVSPVPTQGIVAFSPWGSYKLNVTGYHLMTSAGARIDGGGMSAPGLPGAVGSYWTFSAATASLQASVVNLGPTRATQIPIVLSTAHLAYVAALEGFITSTIIPGLGVPGSSVAAATAWTALLLTMAPMKLALVSSSTNSN